MALQRLDESPVGGVVDEDALPGGDDELRAVGAEAEVVDALLVALAVVDLVHPRRDRPHRDRRRLQNQLKSTAFLNRAIVTLARSRLFSRWGMRSRRTRPSAVVRPAAGEARRLLAWPTGEATGTLTAAAAAALSSTALRKYARATHPPEAGRGWKRAKLKVLSERKIAPNQEKNKKE